MIVTLTSRAPAGLLYLTCDPRMGSGICLVCLVVNCGKEHVHWKTQTPWYQNQSDFHFEVPS